MKDPEKLRALLRAGHVGVSITTLEEDFALSVARDAALGLNREIWIWDNAQGIRDGAFTDAALVPDTAEPLQGLSFFARRPRDPLCVALDMGPHLKQARNLRAVRNLLTLFSKTGAQLLLIDQEDLLPASLKTSLAIFDLSLPDEAELEALTRSVLRSENHEAPIHVDISRSVFQAVVRNLLGLTRRQAVRVIREAVSTDRRFDDADLYHVLAAKRRELRSDGALEFIEAPVDLSEIGGLDRLKNWLAVRCDALSDDANKFGVQAPRGVLMLGVQGAGKSLCAKAIASAWKRPLLRMDVGALYDRYVGESEHRLRQSLRQAEAMAPIVLWIDEIEKAFASAASQSTDGGLSKRMFGALLTWMQEHKTPVFLVATANDIEALPPELLRKGRFDEIFFVDLPGPASRREILTIHLRRRSRDPANFDLDALTEASEAFSGAEIEQAILAALHEAFSTKKPFDTACLLRALRSSPPLSTTMAERVAELRVWAQGRCVPAE